MAELIQRRQPADEVTGEEENWPRLSWWKYHFHLITATHDGFGEEFLNKHGLTIGEIETVWRGDGPRSIAHQCEALECCRARE